MRQFTAQDAAHAAHAAHAAREERGTNIARHRPSRRTSPGGRRGEEPPHRGDGAHTGQTDPAHTPSAQERATAPRAPTGRTSRTGPGRTSRAGPGGAPVHTGFAGERRSGDHLKPPAGAHRRGRPAPAPHSAPLHLRPGQRAEEPPQPAPVFDASGRQPPPSPPQPPTPSSPLPRPHGRSPPRSRGGRRPWRSQRNYPPCRAVQAHDGAARRQCRAVRCGTGQYVPGPLPPRHAAGACGAVRRRVPVTVRHTGAVRRPAAAAGRRSPVRPGPDGPHRAR
jgi:hypothetical protein